MISAVILVINLAEIKCADDLDKSLVIQEFDDDNKLDLINEQQVLELAKVLSDFMELQDKINADEDNDFRLKKRGYNKNTYRRHQASRWDIGFGKRGAASKDTDKSSFLTNLFRLSKKYGNDFGRRQHWDISYGK